NLHLELDSGEGSVDLPFSHCIGGGGVSMSPCHEERVQGLTLPVAGRTEDSPGVEAVVVAIHQVDFEGSECVSSLTAAMAVEAMEEVWRWSDICQRLKMRRGPQTTSWPN
ncbi:hypothetical protein POSPLADRAFT_1160116, partial [Postia placenta MAD-698-R-SB12]